MAEIIPFPLRADRLRPNPNPDWVRRAGETLDRIMEHGMPVYVGIDLASGPDRHAETAVVRTPSGGVLYIPLPTGSDALDLDGMDDDGPAAA